ncbi:MAG: PDZ domain-containing protein [Clostridiaceae bacterium]|nr:PDZ domain-containing protein [Clostridiaceae bacterium]
MKKNRALRYRTAFTVLAVLLLFSCVTANAALCDASQLIPLGNAAGISLSTEGVLIVGLSGVKTGNDTVYPARDAGLCEGDVIVSIDGTQIDTVGELQTKLAEAREESSITVKRDGKELTFPVRPVKTEEGSVRIGVWIRDNMLGIGTLTFYDPESGVYGALGHGINDKNSGHLLSIEGGDLLHSTIEGVKRGESGTPGELQGTYEPQARIGSVFSNTAAGIFGELDEAPSGRPVPVARTGDVRLGEASILSCVAGCEPKTYSIRICALYRTGEMGNRDMLIEVTDKALLETTGGIVQGMSGSPILQNGAIVGAVTHV